MAVVRPVHATASLSLTLRVTLLFAAGSTAVLLALGQLIGISVERHFVELDRDVVEGKFTTSAALLSSIRRPADLERLEARFASMLVGHDGLALRVDDASGRLWFASAAARALSQPGSPAAGSHAVAPDARSRAGTLPVQWTHEGRTFRGLSRELPSALADRRAFRVTIGVDTAHHDHYMQSFRRTLWTFVAIAVLATGLLGWIAARSGLAPLRRLGREAEGVTASRLDRRLTSGDLPVEVAELAATLNDMLARLEDSFRRLSELSSDLAHELRTPLSNLMTQTQVGLSRARSADDYREVLANNSEELERLARMVSDMLFLAKSEHGLAQPVRDAVDLHAMARQVLSFYEALAAERRLGLALQVDGDAVVPGDRNQLLRVLTNLVSNAIRHASAGSSVNVLIGPPPRTTAPAGGGTRAQRALSPTIAAGHARIVRMSVCNHGEVVPPEVLARMFDRFYRGDSSRRHDTEGAGLGLAIVRSIAASHGAGVGASSDAGLTCVFVDLPAG
ncbi:MAG: heavy metal sensor histidine kinase [bacterium]|jgi:two-component system heavy metal sensor histidine kinase CusS|nr:heavy metal sensor histidine kinase [Rhodocyclaceae bacterium]MCA3120018.1 heavy metal sensor histidine kinase [Rhodocyclaceae bacterium]MCA4901004.1 heavy metal sensor histidine kinase [Rhodocyclaceae bacterium]MCE2978313.1 heavy metal sensor histidine kinase [Betaproteobacteria bacterium]